LPINNLKHAVSIFAPPPLPTFRIPSCPRLLPVAFQKIKLTLTMNILKCAMHVL